MKNLSCTFLLFSTVLLQSYKLSAQICVADVEAIDYCVDQYAEFVVNDADADANYYWYSAESGGIDYGMYNERFVPEIPMPAGSGSVSYWYSKQVTNFEGHAVPAEGAVNGVDMAGSVFAVFNAKSDMTIHSVVFAAYIDYVDPGVSYRFVVQIEQNGNVEISQPVVLQGSQLRLLSINGSNTYAVPIPLNINIAKGNNYSIGITERSPQLKYALYSFDNVTAPLDDDFIYFESLSFEAYGANYGVPFFDWEITAYCPRQKVTSNQESNRLACCSPLQTPVELLSTNRFVELPFSDELLASGGTNVYYKWFYEGQEITGASGFASQYLKIDNIGTYKVRVAYEENFIDRKSCYQETEIEIALKKLKASDDMNLCLGEKVQLEVTGAIGSVVWTPDVAMDDNTSLTPTIQPESDAIYTVTADVFGGSTFPNGSFDEPILPYSSDYTNAANTGGIANQKYVIGNKVDNTSPNGVYLWEECISRHGEGNNFMWVDGAVVPNQNILEYTTQVTMNKDYDFDMWIANIAYKDGMARELSNPGNPPSIQVYINDQPVGGLYQHSGDVCQWKQHAFTWNSGNVTQAVVRIVETSNSNFENDFALDDISFGYIQTQTDEVVVSVENCLTIDVSPDTLICLGDSAQLRAYTNGLFMNWKPESTFPKQWSNIQYVSPEEQTTYTVETAYKLGNLIDNGDFEQGLTDKLSNSTDYKAVPDAMDNVRAGSFTVGTNPRVANQYLSELTDHTSGAGNMFIADGSSDEQYSMVYSTQVTVEVGQKYAFSAWIANIHNGLENPAELSFYVNDEKLGELDASGDSKEWINVYYIWEATQGGVITISIQNENKNPNGNDFALDDLEFSPLSPYTVTKEITVSVEECLPPFKGYLLEVCEQENNMASGIDLRPYADSLKLNNSDTVYWFSNAQYTDTLTDVSSLVAQGDRTEFYAQLISDKGNVLVEASIVVAVLPLPKIVLPEFPVLCLDSDPYLIEGTVPAGGIYLGATISDSAVFTPRVLGANAVTYQVMGDNGCFAEVEAFISVVSSEKITFSKPDEICADVANIDLSRYVSPPIIGALGMGEFVGETVTPTGLFSHSGKGEYTVYYKFKTVNGCISSASQSVVVHEMPSVEIGPDTSGICISSDIVLSGNSSGGQKPYVHRWDVSHGKLSSVTEQSPVFSSDVAANVLLSYTVTDRKGCFASATRLLKVVDLPEVSIDHIPSLCVYDPTITMTATVQPAGGIGFFEGNNISGEGEFNPQEAVVVKNKIKYSYTDPYGCSNTDEFTIVVNPIPQLKLMSRDYECVNGKPFSVSPNFEGGTFAGTGIDKKGVFSPADAVVGVNEIVYFYIDPVTGCENSVTKKITVHPLPQPDFLSQSVFCDYDQAVEITLTPFEAGNSLLLGKGVSINGSSAVFDPAKAGEGAHNIIYIYTSKYGCTDSIIKTYTVHHTDVPVTKDAFGLITARSVEIDAISATITQPDAQLIWYDATGKNEVSRDNPFVTGIEEIGSFTFYARQYLNGCYSDSVPAQLNVVECTAPVPEVINDSICEGDDIKPVAAVHNTNFSIGWFHTSSTDVQPFWNKESYLPENPKLGRNEYWVAHYNNERNCWSAAAKVVFTVHKMPQVAIDNVSQHNCDYSNAIIPLLSHQGGTLFLNGHETNYRKFNPDELGAGNYSLRYEYTDPKTGCGDSAKVSFSIYHTDPPVGEDITHQNRYMPKLPKLVVQGTSVRWYADEIATNFLGQGNSYETGLVDTAVRTYTYYPTQTINGCESKPVPLRIHIVRCPTPAPIGSGVSVCVYDNMPGLTALEASDWQVPPTGNGRMMWFSNLSQDINDTVAHKLFSGNSVFYPDIQSKGMHTFFVAEWDHGCLSPKTPVVVEIKETLPPDIRADDVCLFDNGNTIVSDQINTFWFASDDIHQEPLSKGDIFEFTTQFPHVVSIFGSYKNNGCFSSPVPVSAEVIPLPQPPSIALDTIELCEGSALTYVLDAGTYEGSNVRWYASALAMPSSVVSLSKLEAGRVYEFKVQQDSSAKHCWSSFSNVYIDYIATPDKPEIEDPGSYCLGEQINPIKIDPLYLEMNEITQIKWFDADETLKSAGTQYVPDTVVEAQSIDFSVVAFNRQCQSDVLIQSLIVKMIPQVAISGKDSVCVQDGERLYVIDNPQKNYLYNWILSSETSTIKPVQVELANGGSNVLVEWMGPGVDTLYCQTSLDGCSSFDTLVVHISDYPEVRFDYSVFLNSGTVQFDNHTSPVMFITDNNFEQEQNNTCTWYFYTSFGDTVQYNQTDDIAGSNPFIQKGFTYGRNIAHLRVVNDYGCAVDSSVVLYMDMETSLFVPNSFAPDGPNSDVRIFHPKGINLDSYHIYIYDVWGNLLWFSNKLTDTQPAEGWDGTYQGVPLKADSYIWRIEATFLNGYLWKGAPTKKEKYSTIGTVNLIR